MLATLIRLNGTRNKSVRDVQLHGLTFTHSRTTYMEKYEVPSGGDWSIHRGGAVFAQGVENLKIDSCNFEQLGGNGLFLSNYCRQSTISNSTFAFIGDSAVAAVGSTKYRQTRVQGVDLMDGTTGEQPAGTVLERTLIHETGLYGKQTSGFVQMLAWNTTIRSCVLFNGPRAGIVSATIFAEFACKLLTLPMRFCRISMMGKSCGVEVAVLLVVYEIRFGGGNHIESNLLFNWVRETSDHGKEGSMGAR